jgi:hypothetical protein
MNLYYGYILVEVLDTKASKEVVRLGVAIYNNNISPLL